LPALKAARKSATNRRPPAAVHPAPSGDKLVVVLLELPTPSRPGADELLAVHPTASRGAITHARAGTKIALRPR
jgi:hypothetical protein